MKKLLYALPATALIGTAFAQSPGSSVRFWGTVDLGIAHTSQGGTSRTFMSNAGGLSSLLGLRGIEDLGDGMSTGFWLEGSLNGSVGSFGAATPDSPNTMFNRRSTVSLTSRSGEIRLGRDYVPSFWNETMFDPFGSQGIGAGYIISAMGTNIIGGEDGVYVRASRAIQYLWGFAPNAHGTIGTGFYGQLMYAFPDDTTTGNRRYAGGRVGYADGPLHVAAAYATSRGPGTGSPVNPANAETNATSTYKTWNIGARWRFEGIGSVLAKYGVNDSNVPGTKWTHWALGATIAAGPGYIPVSYNRTKNDDAGAYGAGQFAVGYVYYLSKRTSLYGAYAHLRHKNYSINNQPGTSFNVGDDWRLTRDPAFRPGDNGTAYQVGMTHSF